MTRLAALTTATILAATPLVAEQATKAYNDPTSEVYSENFPPEDGYGSAGLMGSDVYTTNRGMADKSATDLDHDSLTRIGTVEDVVMNAKGNMSGIMVAPEGTTDKLWFVPASSIIVVQEADGPRFMISHTSEEMSQLGSVERQSWN